MKKSVLLLFIFLCLNSVLYGQGEEFSFDKRILYQITNLSDSTDQNSVRKTIAELLINDSISLFRTQEKGFRDEEYQNPPAYPMPKITFSGGTINNSNYQILKNNSGEIKVYDEYSGSNLEDLTELNYYTEKMDPTKWEVTEDTLSISGFNCQKAILEYGGRIWEAYFTTEIPIAQGPYKFCGLPGIIVKISDASQSWTFDLMEIKDIDQNISINNKKSLKIKKTTKEDLYRQRRKYQKDQIQRGQSSGEAYDAQNVERGKQIEERISKDNNWIELYH